MEIIISILAGFLFTVGVYNILQKQLLRIAIGTGLISHGAHLFILTMGKLKNGQPPIIQEGITEYTDPLPQALDRKSTRLNSSHVAISYAVFCLKKKKKNKKIKYSTEE